MRHPNPKRIVAWYCQRCGHKLDAGTIHLTNRYGKRIEVHRICASAEEIQTEEERQAQALIELRRRQRTYAL